MAQKVAALQLLKGGDQTGLDLSSVDEKVRYKVFRAGDH